MQFPDGRGLLDKLNGLNAWCKVTVLHLECCGLGEAGGRALAEALRLNTSLKVLDHCNHYGGLNYAVGLGEGGGRALAEALRLSTTLTSLDLRGNRLRWGEGRTQTNDGRLDKPPKLLPNTVEASLLRTRRAGGLTALTSILRLVLTLFGVCVYYCSTYYKAVRVGGGG